MRITNAVVYDDRLGRSRQPVFERQTGFFLLILCGLRIGSQMHEEVRVRGRIEVAERCNDVGIDHTTGRSVHGIVKFKMRQIVGRKVASKNLPQSFERQQRSELLCMVAHENCAGFGLEPVLTVSLSAVPR